MIRYLRHRWGAEGGYRQFLALAIPLILSTAAWSVQHFVDRVFLAWYSTEALAAALPAGMANFVIVSFFIGVVSYVNTFVAQYVGARRPERVGPAVWQGAYLAILSGLVGLGVASQSGTIFRIVGHDAAIRSEEIGRPASSTNTARSPSPSKATPKSAPTRLTASDTSARFSSLSGSASWFGKVPSGSK